MNNKHQELIKEMVKGITTHYWIRTIDVAPEQDWRIEKVSSKNFHYINDPEYYGCEVVAIPNSPTTSTQALDKTPPRC